ncbi:MAG: Ig-like domain-containing protein, partial [Porticoccaceae bacterium]|nr:Ig-like domain-containing protein [Porticoccaceae bacterium]
MAIKIKISSHGELNSEKNHVLSTDKIALQNPSDISLAITPEEVVLLEKVGGDLIVHLIDGAPINITGFFQFDEKSHLYFQDQDFEGQIWRADIPELPAEGSIHWTTDSRLTTAETAKAIRLLPADDSSLLPANDTSAQPTQGSSLFLGGLVALGGITAAALNRDSSSSRQDSTPPNTPEVDPTSGDTATGTAEPNSTITLTLNGEVIGESQADSDGNWTIDVETDLEHGDILQVTATDPLGNRSPTAEETVDRLGPTVTLDALLTNDSTPSLSGTVDDNEATIVVTVDGVEYPAVNNGDGSWSMPKDAIATLPEGLANVHITATDPLSNIASTQGQIEIDLTAPPAPEINPSNGTLLTGTAESGTHISLSIADEEVATVLVDSNGIWSWSPQQGLANDTEVIAVAIDDAGNISPPEIEIVDIEFAGNNPPDAPIISNVYDDRLPVTDPLSSGGTTNDTTPTLVGSAEAFSTVTIFQNNISVGTTTANDDGSWTYTLISLGNGNYTFTATATDASGNLSAVSTSFNLTIDTTVDDTPVNPTPDNTPIVAISEDSNNDGTLNGTELSGAVDITITLPGGAVADDTIRVSDGSTTTDVVLDATDITNGSVTTTFASPGEGNTLTVTAVLIDQIGNTSPAGSDSVTVDTLAGDTGAAPTVVISEDSNNDGTLNGTELSGAV